MKKRAFLEQFIGCEQQVLVQQFDRKTGLCRGLSRNYVGVAFAGKSVFVNSEIRVRMLQSDGVSCSGEMVTV